MKPLHIGLLVIGAALAGALAVKMTEPLPIPRAAQSAQPAARPPVVTAPPAPKTSPIPYVAPPALSAPDVTSTPAIATAPEPVYDERPQPVVRKNKPILTASVKPTQWTPLPYKAPSQPVQPAPQPSTTAPEPPVVEQAAAEPAQPAPAPRHVTLTTGMTIPVRIDESLSSERSAVGDTFHASLAEPLVVDGLVIAEKGAKVTGRIVDSQKAGRLRGTSSLQLGLATIETSDGQEVALNSDPWTKPGEQSYREDAARIGGGAALGAIIGAIAGGGAGAAIGAGAGGAAGAGVAMASRGKPASVPPETIVRFRLASTVTVFEQQIAGR